MQETKGEQWFRTVNAMFLSLVSLSMLLPFIHVLAKALSHDRYVLAKEVTLWPKGFQTGAFEFVLNNKQFLISFGNSIFITVVGTAISILITMFTAYPLSRKIMPHRRAIMFLYVLTMFFSGGLIPTYLVVKGLSLTNSLWSLILPVALAPFNLILLKNFFSSVPDDMEESAKMDGASNLRILFTIYAPLSMAAIATISMFYAVGYWNSFFQALMYITDRNLIPLQVYLMQIITDQMGMDLANAESMMNTAAESVRAATIIAAVVPILLIYPFVQKYFVKGVMLGAVKG
ncbi:carbohydrate ABC transporter permease [Paenibacillus daejeonensis]|uniref:carbohydrate ABC transporter permease n=1 Tax=Paenibacillus daejeonensis TaxID=135193 RepID=UPI00036423A6|nr:carbohydrate ABC transporter permease [Paenibacillus daejeonensis]